MNLNELKKLAKELKEQGSIVKEPLPVTLTGTTFGNELQTKILTTLRVSNLFLFYLCCFATFRYIMQGN